MLERDNTGLLTLFRENDMQEQMSLQASGGQPMLWALAQDFMYLREAGTKERCSSTSDGNWKKHSIVFLITDSRGKAFLPQLEEGGN